MTVCKLSTIIATLEAQPMGSAGLTMVQISELTGYDMKRLNSAVVGHMLAKKATIVMVARAKNSRYYASQAHLEAGRAALAEADAAHAAEVKQRRVLRDRARYAKKREGAAPRKRRKRKQAVLGLSRESKPKARVVVEATNPNNVQPVTLPGYTGVSRFAPAANSEGAGFMAEWRQKRGAA